jgi:hypothetical protein
MEVLVRADIVISSQVYHPPLLSAVSICNYLLTYITTKKQTLSFCIEVHLQNCTIVML